MRLGGLTGRQRLEPLVLSALSWDMRISPESNTFSNRKACSPISNLKVVCGSCPFSLVSVLFRRWSRLRRRTGRHKSCHLCKLVQDAQVRLPSSVIRSKRWGSSIRHKWRESCSGCNGKFQVDADSATGTARPRKIRRECIRQGLIDAFHDGRCKEAKFATTFRDERA